MIILDVPVAVPFVMPDWAQILVFIATPLATLLGAAAGILIIFKRVATVSEKVTNLEVKVDGRLSQLLEAKNAELLANEKHAFERGVVEGQMRQDEIAKAIAARLLADEGLMARGEARLLEKQQTAPMVSSGREEKTGSTSDSPATDLVITGTISGDVSGKIV